MAPCGSFRQRALIALHEAWPEAWHVASLGYLDANEIGRAFGQIIIVEFLAHHPRYRTDDRIALGIVRRRPAKDLATDGGLFDFIGAPFERFSDHKCEER